MPNTEALLLVYHQQAKILEMHILLQQRMSAYHNVHATVGKASLGGSDLCGSAESRENLDADGVSEKALDSGLVMLLRQYCGRNKDGGLFAV